MDAPEIRKRILDHYGIRIDPEMSEYVLRRLQEAGNEIGQPIPVMGGDARTGVAIAQTIDPQQLRAS